MDHLSRLAKLIHSKLRALGFSSPRVSVTRALLETTYLASLKTEEGHFVRGSLTFANPEAPEDSPPFTRRASYPGFTAFRHPLPLTRETLVKLSRAIDKWSGSIAVFGRTSKDLVAWGVVDQIVHQSIYLNRESQGGFMNPGTLILTMDSVGEFSAYHANVFLAGLKQGRIVTHENRALQSKHLRGRITPALNPFASKIAQMLGNPGDTANVLESLFDEWSNTIARLCIGLRRLSTGGAFLISPKPLWALLDVSHHLSYRRLGDSVILRVLDRRYVFAQNRQVDKQPSIAVPRTLVRELQFAEAECRRSTR